MIRQTLEKVVPDKISAVRVSPPSNLRHIFVGEKELISQTAPDGSTIELAMYVGLVNGKLKGGR